LNLLAMLGWNSGTEQEIFTLDELIANFSIDRVSKAGAKFDFEKAKWYNAEWIKKKSAEELVENVKGVLDRHAITVADDDYLVKVINAVKDRCTLLNDFYAQSVYFFETPAQYDLNSVKPKWTDTKTDFFGSLIARFREIPSWEPMQLEIDFKYLCEETGFKIGDVMLPFRIMLVGGKFGPHVFDIAALLGREETIARIEKALVAFSG